MKAERGSWGSRFTFVLAAAGSAIGLGNVWGFPTQTGLNGGAAFVLVYLVCVFLIGVPVMIAELAIGRKAKSDPVGAFKTLMPNSHWKLVGALGVTTGLVILSYYSVIAGWTLKYLWITSVGEFVGTGSAEIGEIFRRFTASGPEVGFFHLIFMALTIWVVGAGVRGGIERLTKFGMPVLFVLLVLLVLRSVTLAGAGAGLEFYLKPDFTKINPMLVISALGQAFFSLSLGMGAMITYGSYLSEREDLVSSAFYVSLSDLLIAFLAGFAIFPALFSVQGLSPDAGPGLIFVVLPNIFNQIPLGQAFGAAFYLLLVIAALTSSISLLEVVVAYLIDQRGWARRRAAAAAGTAAFLLGIPSALSSDFLGRTDFIFGKVALVVGAFFICIFLAWKWGIDKALLEIESSTSRFRLRSAFVFLIRYVCPVAILLILMQQIRGML